MFNKNDLIRFFGKDRVEENKDLFSYLTLRTKAIARYFFIAKSKEDLQKAKKASIKFNFPMLLLGGGSNIATLKNNLNYLVVKNEYIEKKILNESSNEVCLLISSGYPMSMVVDYTVKSGYQGFEYHKGLPGTLGGAIAMNSKWMRPESYISDTLTFALLIDNNGEFKKVNRRYFRFAYGYSILKQTGEILVEAEFCCKKTDPQILKQRADEALDYRKKTQPFGTATAGCFFKNISEKIKSEKNLPSSSAGYLIDKLGMKNLSVGSYSVSDKHANFIINKGHGQSEDLYKLVEIIKNKVREVYGIELEEEVVVIN